MQSHPQDRIDSKPEPSPMATVGAILAQGAIRYLDRQKRQRKAVDMKNFSEPLKSEHSKTIRYL